MLILLDLTKYCDLVDLAADVCSNVNKVPRTRTLLGSLAFLRWLVQRGFAVRCIPVLFCSLRSVSSLMSVQVLS